MREPPHRAIENELIAQGCTRIVGIDEVGKGAWAGPLVVGAAVIPADITNNLDGVRDSKQISEKKREAIFDAVASWVVDWSLGIATNNECDELGMSAAQKLATKRALDALAVPPDAAIADGKWDFVSPHVSRVEMRVKADNESLSVAAASILAKVSRDRMMRQFAIEFPGYAFDSNKGYPCAKQRAGLAANGPCAIHRVSWSFMDKIAVVDEIDSQNSVPTLFSH